MIGLLYRVVSITRFLNLHYIVFKDSSVVWSGGWVTSMIPVNNPTCVAKAWYSMMIMWAITVVCYLFNTFSAGNFPLSKE